jgi:hypothetical protein
VNQELQEFRICRVAVDFHALGDLIVSTWPLNLVLPAALAGFAS